MLQAIKDIANNEFNDEILGFTYPSKDTIRVLFCSEEEAEDFIDVIVMKNLNLNNIDVICEDNSVVFQVNGI